MSRNSLLNLLPTLSWALAALGQSAPPATLEIDTANLVIYRHDVPDPTRLSTEPGPTTPLPVRTFMPVTWIGDVVAVNGMAVKGTLVIRGTWVSLSPSPAPGSGIADTTNSLASDWLFDILRPDGSPVGTIVATGWGLGSRTAGSPPPGQGNLAVIGGTGAFVGVRGQGKETTVTLGARTAASVTEDPSRRRIHGGRSSRFSFQLVPLARSEFVFSANGNGIFHSDFSPVTASHPATRGELLIAAVTGLGPTLPGKQPEAPFPADNLQQVASPVQVLVNGTAVDASNQVGWPGTLGTYRVDFRVPEDASPGMATVQVVAAWIPGPPIQIPVL